jgi:hypothetical protein
MNENLLKRRLPCGTALKTKELRLVHRKSALNKSENNSKKLGACKVKTQQKVCFIAENTIYGGVLNPLSGHCV